MAVLNVKQDARRAFEVVTNQGIAIMPMDVGYSLIGGSAAALKKIFDTKKRTPAKLNAMLGNDDLHRELHIVSERGRAIYQALCHDYDLPLGLIAPCRADHPLLKRLDTDTYARSTKDNTLLMLVNAGKFHAEITRLSFENEHLLFGSSANISLSGTKFKGADIEPQIRAIADIVIDYGLMKYHRYRASSTLLDVETCTVHRIGVCYENIVDILQRHFNIELAPQTT